MATRKQIIGVEEVCDLLLSKIKATSDAVKHEIAISPDEEILFDNLDEWYSLYQKIVELDSWIVEVKRDLKKEIEKWV